MDTKNVKNLPSLLHSATMLPMNDSTSFCYDIAEESKGNIYVFYVDHLLLKKAYCISPEMSKQ